MRNLLVIIAAMGFLSSSSAQEIDVVELPSEVLKVMGEKAQELGFDLTTKEGKDQFAKYMKKQRHEQAKKLGIKIDSPKGEKQFEARIEKELKKEAREQRADMSTPQGREKVVREMMKSGQLAFVPTEARPFEKQGFQPQPVVDFRQMSPEVKHLMAEKAQELGFNLATKEGKDGFAKYVVEQREKKAQELGINIYTEKGEQQFEQQAQKEVKEAARLEKTNPRDEKGRREVVERMIDKGEIAFVPTDKEGLKKQGWQRPEPRLDVRQLPPEVQGAMAEKAAEMGIDISSREGQRELGNFVEQEREKQAEKFGINIYTQKGEQQFEKRAQSEMQKMARQKGANMNSAKGRKQVMQAMMSTGQVGMMPEKTEGFQKMGFNSSPSSKGNRMGKESASQTRGYERQRSGQEQGGQKRMEGQRQSGGFETNRRQASVNRQPRVGQQQQQPQQRQQPNNSRPERREHH